MKTLEYLQHYLKGTLTYPHWGKIGIKHHHGISAPLFALRTYTSCGIGEYLDLILLIDWIKQIDFEVIQLLPLNDTGEDPSPYNALSSKALDPIYLSLHQLPFVDDHPDLMHEISIMRQLNKSERISYQKVKLAKYNWLKMYFSKVFHKFEHEESFLEFEALNPWLETYALYRVLKDKGNNKSWKSWPDELKSPKKLQPLVDKYKKELNFYILLQYLAFSQMKQVKEYANQNNVFIKGDIPILLSSDSADVWTYPHLFCKDGTAGAPPDAYSAKGQNWGFPIFNWKAHEVDNFSWWKQRLLCASQCYHLYRIDHVVGFFRIWMIPHNKQATDGHYRPKNIHLWPRQGRKLLKMMIESSSILPMAEDLGTIPKFVFQILKKFGICGTKVIRWERRWEENADYIPVKDYEPLSMTSVSTHDSEPLALWWKKYPLDAKLYSTFKGWEYTETFTNKMREEVLYDAHHSASLFHINPLQEYLAFFPELISAKPEDERINIPGTSSPLNWTYRFRPFIEEMMTHTKLNKIMHKLIH